MPEGRLAEKGGLSARDRVAFHGETRMQEAWNRYER